MSNIWIQQQQKLQKILTCWFADAKPPLGLMLYIIYIYNFSFETQVMLICSFSCGTEILWASLLAQMVMNLPAIQGAPVHP